VDTITMNRWVSEISEYGERGPGLFDAPASAKCKCGCECTGHDVDDKELRASRKPGCGCEQFEVMEMSEV
jgi:hypothetical protein